RVPCGDGKVGVPVVVQINEQCARRIVQPVDSGHGGNIDQFSIGLLSKQQVGQPARLAKIEVFETVSIDISQRQSVITQKIGVQRVVDATDPCVHAQPELLAPC